MGISNLLTSPPPWLRCYSSAFTTLEEARWLRPYSIKYPRVDTEGAAPEADPPKGVNPIVIEAMREIGIDISGNRPKKLTKEMSLEADLAITMGCEEDACPVVPNELRDWQLEDPQGEPIETVRKIRDEIQLKVRTLIRELDDTPIK